MVHSHSNNFNNFNIQDPSNIVNLPGQPLLHCTPLKVILPQRLRHHMQERVVVTTVTHRLMMKKHFNNILMHIVNNNTKITMMHKLLNT